jgi:hypothetical protein
LRDERREKHYELEEAGWERIERPGWVFWRNPKSGYLYPQEVALEFVREDVEAGDYG